MGGICYGPSTSARARSARGRGVERGAWSVGEGGHAAPGRDRAVGGPRDGAWMSRERPWRGTDEQWLSRALGLGAKAQDRHRAGAAWTDTFLSPSTRPLICPRVASHASPCANIPAAQSGHARSPVSPVAPVSPLPRAPPLLPTPRTRRKRRTRPLPPGIELGAARPMH